VDEPVGDVLDGINHGVIDHFKARSGGGDDDSLLPFEEVLYPLSLLKSKEADTPLSLSHVGSVNVAGLSPDELQLVLTRGSPVTSPWKLALFGSRLVVHGRDLADNPV
jgi:enoyl reductase-like protein